MIEGNEQVAERRVDFYKSFSKAATDGKIVQPRTRRPRRGARLLYTSTASASAYRRKSTRRSRSFEKFPSDLCKVQQVKMRQSPAFIGMGRALDSSALTWISRLAL